MNYKSAYTKNTDIIATANTMADLSEWTFEEWDITPALALTVLRDHVGNEFSTESIGIGGTCNATTKTIRLFTKGMKSQGRMRWTLCHELGHAIHFQNHPSSTNWHTSNKEQFADAIGLQIENKWFESH